MQINLINVLTNTGQGYIESIFAYQMLGFLTVQFPSWRLHNGLEGQIIDVLGAMLISLTHTPAEKG